MKVSVKVYKIICAIYSTDFFFTSGGSVDDVLVRLSLVAQIIKDAHLICILFSVKHLQTFWESWMSLSNVYTYPFNQQLVMKTYVESHDKKRKDQRNFYIWSIMGLFQSWLDCLSIGVQAFIQNINFLIFSRLCMLVPITTLHFLNALTCSLITLFFKFIQLHQILSLFSTINNKSCMFAGN